MSPNMQQVNNVYHFLYWMQIKPEILNGRV